MEKQRLHSSKKSSIEELFGDVLKQLRDEKGISQEELGFESGYHRTYISMLEGGKKSPSLKTILQLAKALDVTPSDIMNRLQAMVTDSSAKKNPSGSVKK
jgi:transcriptional regulator with XRE-family HTH domain